MKSLSFVDKSFLIDNIALRFPLPNNNLAKLLEPKADPCAGRINSERTYFTLTH
jgi:hypothetical protein